MAEDRFEPREVNFRQLLPWTVLFRGFQVALDLKKLLLAAAGILVMAVGWQVLATVFYTSDKPDWTGWNGGYFEQRISALEAKGLSKEDAVARAWKEFKDSRQRWNLLHEAAGPTQPPLLQDAGDLAESPQGYETMRERLPEHAGVVTIDGKTYTVAAKPAGVLSSWPWLEDRGPNPFLMITGRAGVVDDQGNARYAPWRRGDFVGWFLREQVPTLIEPLIKFFRPMLYLLDSRAGLREQVYFLLVTVWTLITWAIFGGAITRMAVVQIARNEKIGLGEALRFVWQKRWSYLFASVAPLVFLAALTLLLFLFGIGNLVPIFAELWNGLLWPVALLGGLAMAVTLVGLIGWPMIHVTLSAEGSDSFDALSRSYSYVYQSPWHYLWYCTVAIVYGAVLVFFVGLMGSMTVYLTKWGVSRTTFGTGYRDLAYLFQWAPTSYDWRQLLGGDSPVTDLRAWNWIGVALVTLWTHLLFLMVVGFGYSYFWTASSIIYLLMRRKVDDTELDEVYLEEEPEDSYTTATAGPYPGTASAPTSGTVTMVEPPALRPSAPPTPGPSPAGEAPAERPVSPATVEGSETAPSEEKT